MPSENLASVRAGYDAFARGDIDAVLAQMQDDIEWVTPDSTPLGGRYHGKQEVLGFFGRLAELMEGLSVDPREYIESDDRVVVLCRITGRGRGGPADVEACHVWRMRDGKAAGFMEYVDTARIRAALGEPATMARAGD